MKKYRSNSKNPIFIHSLFRTGSTYIWNKFRQINRYYCYYEPFHPVLSEITPETPNPWAYDDKTTNELRHPRVEKNYLFEYKKLITPGQKGVPFFKKSFSFDDFCNNDYNPDMKRYIDNLIAAAESEGKIPVFQFNRSAFRIKWFKKYFPGSLNIYLVRNSRDQFQSYISMLEDNKLDIFLAMDLLVTGVNLDSKYFKTLAVYIPLFEYHSHLFEDEQFIYSCLLPFYSTAEKYYIFYFIWFSALLENVVHADFLVNIDLLSTNLSYRRKVEEALNTPGIKKIDFSDATIGHYKKYILTKMKMKQIEEAIKSLIIKKYINKELERFDKNIDPNNRAFFKLDKPELYRLKKMAVLTIDIGKDLTKKYQLLFNHFSRELVNHNHHIRKLQMELLQKSQQLNQKDQQLTQKNIYIEKMLNSKSYRVGRFILSPFILLKRITRGEKGKDDEC